MASLNNMFFSPIVVPQRRAVRSGATSAKGPGARSEEKGILDFILGGLTKQEQFYETDPIFSKNVEEESIGGGGTTTVSGRKGSAAPPAPQPKKKDGGFDLGGLFAKK